jgi:hypothetical protein
MAILVTRRWSLKQIVLDVGKTHLAIALDYLATQA